MTKDKRRDVHKCEVCGSEVNIVGKTTLHYEPIYTEAREKKMIKEIRSALTKKHEVAGADCTCKAWGSCECGCGASWKTEKEKQRDDALATINKYKGTV